MILNGLGATKYEELFVVWRTAAELLRNAGYTLVDPEVGELVTSLDMAGCSLTVAFLDDELESLWRAPADTPAYRKGAAAQASDGARRTVDTETTTDATPTAASAASQRCGAAASAVLTAMADALDEAADELGRIDAVAGDGDHGRGMTKGSAAARAAAAAAAPDGAGVATVLSRAGDAWAATAGGTSGVLWGAALSAVGATLGDDAEEITGAQVAAAIRAGLDTIIALGKAKVRDKTMLDALVPFVDTLDEQIAAGASLTQAWITAADAAEQAARATADLRPQVGRARPLAERSVGTPDAGSRFPRPLPTDSRRGPQRSLALPAHPHLTAPTRRPDR